MNPFEIFDELEIQKIKEVENLENRNYTKDELQIIEQKILEDIMSNSSKNGDIDKARNEYRSVIDKFERCK